LLTQASPQQRAAIVLKDIFDFTAQEIAVMLSTTVGAVKSALHRAASTCGKRRPRAMPRRAPRPRN